MTRRAYPPIVARTIRVGSAGGCNSDGVIRDSGQRSLDGGLHAHRMRLRLPSGERAAVVLKAESDSHKK